MLSFIAVVLMFCCPLAIKSVCVTESNVLPNVDLMGYDLPIQPSPTNSLQECVDLCCTQVMCIAVSRNANGLCYLKNGSAIQGKTNITGVYSVIFSLPAWYDVSLPRSQRVQALVDIMTPAELISSLNDYSAAIPRLSIPAYNWEGEALHGVSWAGVATVFPEPIAMAAAFDEDMIADVGRVVAVEARSKWLNGIAPDGSSASMYGLSYMTPNNNLFLDPRWGRGQETYGEDPYLTSKLAERWVRSVQNGDHPEYNWIIANSKHYLGYHIESWAGNGQYRLSHSYNYSDVDLRQYYLKPFQATVRANVSSIMCAYDGMNGTNPEWPNPTGPEPWGVPMCMHPSIQNTLRGVLGYKGYIISDEGAVTFAGPGYHDYTSTVTQAACLALNAGTDLCLGGEFATTLNDCLKSGKITITRLKEAMTRLVEAQMQLGWYDTVGSKLFGFPDPVPYNQGLSVNGNVSTPANRALSRTVAKKSFVLLKNENNLLPLKNVRTLALIGPTATYSKTATSSYLGNYSPCEDSPGGNLNTDPRCQVITLLDAVTAEAKAQNFTLRYAPGTSDVNTPNQTGLYNAAIQAARGADVIVLSLGLDTCQETYCSEGEANDRVVGGQLKFPTLDFPGSQLGLLQVIAKEFPRTPIVLVLMNGGPISSPTGFSSVTAILEAWYGGYEAGRALVDTLFGRYSPAGRMPVTTVSSESELPLYLNTDLSAPPGRTHMYYQGTPLYPFGFGLSYAVFTYSNVQAPTIVRQGSPIKLSVSLHRNKTGTTTDSIVADEVTQVYAQYVGPLSGGWSKIPKQQLVAFKRTSDISAGSVQLVRFSISPDDMALVAPDGSSEVLKGTWMLWVGGGPPSTGQYPGGITPISFEITVQ